MGSGTDFWDTPAIVATLHDAAQGFPRHPLLGKVLPDIASRAKRRLEAQIPGQKFKFQQFVNDELMKVLYPDSIPSMLKRRFPVLEPGVAFDTVDFDAVKQFMAKLTPAWATSILKTWANAWNTTYRLHEPVLRTCFFGCIDMKDDLSHYLRCPCLRNLLGSDGGDVPATDAERLHPTHDCALNLVIMSNLYHASKSSTTPIYYDSLMLPVGKP